MAARVGLGPYLPHSLDKGVGAPAPTPLRVFSSSGVAIDALGYGASGSSITLLFKRVA